MERLKMHTLNFTEENIARIAELFPGCVTETKEIVRDANDSEKVVLKKAIDWDLLKQEISEHIVEGPQERYHLNWPGKRQALLAANVPIAKTLRPCREESVDFDTTENLFIEGDNLDAVQKEIDGLGKELAEVRAKMGEKLQQINNHGQNYGG